jgi:hypothetical protein
LPVGERELFMPSSASRRPPVRPPATLRGRRLAFLTKHGKETVVGPVLERALGCRVELATGFDTDAFGTFTRETPRAGTQLEAARKKARKAIELSGARAGLGSEGAFGPDPFTGFLPWNTELLLYVDDDLGIEVAGWASSGSTNLAHDVVQRWGDLETFALRAGFPAHGLVVRPGSTDDPRAVKDLDSLDALRAAFEAASALAGGSVAVETDLRAHRNPSRKAVIAEAARALAGLLATPCPACQRPGFGVTDRVRGLPCEACGVPTDQLLATILSCGGCRFERREDASGRRVADQGDCVLCNP